MNNRQFEREEEQLEEDLQQGLITPQEFQKQQKEMYRAYAADAREAAEDAYWRELDEW